jgi:hypothetical protein
MFSPSDARTITGATTSERHGLTKQGRIEMDDTRVTDPKRVIQFTLKDIQSVYSLMIEKP